MAVRLIAELVLGLLLLVAILLATYRWAGGGRAVDTPPRTPEFDVSKTPSAWFTDSRTTSDGNTEVCIVRVETKSGLVRERRVLRTLDNDAPGYSSALDEAMDEAYAAMRVANVNLNRR